MKQARLEESTEEKKEGEDVIEKAEEQTRAEKVIFQVE